MPASSSTPADWTSTATTCRCCVNMQPAGKYLGERFHRAGGVPAVMWELLEAGKLDGDCLTVHRHARIGREHRRARERATAR